MRDDQAGIDGDRPAMALHLKVPMSPSVLPLIVAADYPLFQRMIGDLRHVTYDEWVDDHQKAVAYRTSRNGSQEIPVSPAEFDVWLKQNKMSAHLELLWACAEDKAARQTDSAQHTSAT